MAAARRPELFSRLVLIEPLIQSPKDVWLRRSLPRCLSKRIHAVKNILAITQTWPDAKQAFKEHRQQPAYKSISDQHLQTMISAMTYQPTRNKPQLTLRYNKHWQACNELGAELILPPFKQLKTPTLIIRGQANVFCHAKTYHQMKELKPNNLYLEEPDYGHLLPFEAPKLCRQLIFSGLKKLNKTQE